jgi:excinuclease ABC subunit A
MPVLSAAPRDGASADGDGDAEEGLGAQRRATQTSRASSRFRSPYGHTLYILDEPTTGLHFEDIRKLVEVFDRLADGGNTLVVIEHNLDVIKRADWIVDLGPEGGDKGGTVVAAGPPEKVAKVKGSYTGQYLGRMLS